jgi:hypothetical protein
MPTHPACQLMLLGVDRPFAFDWRLAKSDLKTQASVLLFEGCELHAGDVFDLSARTEISVNAYHAPTEMGAGLMHANTLALLLCNTSQSHAQELSMAWRTYLQQQPNLSFEVIYGQGLEMMERIRFAWHAALQKWGCPVGAERTRPLGALRYSAYCEKCSDPLCESRLFGLRTVNNQCT